MKRTFVVVLGVTAAVAMFGGLVYAALTVAHVSEPAAITVQGLTVRRLWATASTAVAFIGLVIGAMGLRRSSLFSTESGRLAAIAALAAGLFAAGNGGLNLAVANGGPGSGNGVVGGAAALVLGLIALMLGGLALARSHRAA